MLDAFGRSVTQRNSVVRSHSPLPVTAALLAFGATQIASAGFLVETARLGETGVTRDDAINGIVAANNVSPNVFGGARFELQKPAKTSQIGGHFVGPFSEDDEFFGAIVRLADLADFPDSSDLSTPDVIGIVLLTSPDPSADVAAPLKIHLDPGWYALVLGSGLFAAEGRAAAVLNNEPFGGASLFSYVSGSGWGESANNGTRLFLRGVEAPEPTGACVMAGLALSATAISRVRVPFPR